LLPQLVTLAYVQTLFPSQGIDAKEFINAFLVSTAIEETIIVSEEHGRQICPGRLVVQSRAHQRHWLDDPKAILEAPAKKV